MSERYDDGRSLAMLIAGFGLGTLVGTVIGLLVAPKAGRELRADIVESGRDYYDKVKDRSRDVYAKGRERARQAYEEGRHRAADLGGKVGAAVADAKDKVVETASRMTEAVRSGIEHARETVAAGTTQNPSEDEA